MPAGAVLDWGVIRTEATRVHCGHCGTELLPGKKFCHACGTRVVAACPSCGATVEAQFRFCPDCGTSLPLSANGSEAPEPAGAAPPEDVVAEPRGALAARIPDELAQKILANRAAMSGERKVVTVVFCDLVGSTAIAERLDPEEYRDLLAQYLDVAFEQVYRFEGFVNQMAGDGVMALFGAPVAHEDAPQRAVRAALAIREALHELSERIRAERGVHLEARFGVHTGPVVVGTVGSDLKMDYTAIGDTTNLAARLQTLAEPGAILVSEVTERRLRGYFQFEPAGVFDVKGKREPVRAYRVLGACHGTNPFSVATARGLTPFVGRLGELAQLRGCYERLVEGLSQVVAIVGAAGSGKSRLVYEFHQQAVGSDAIVLEARCSALTQSVPYAPWVSMLKQYFELLPGDTPAVAVAKLTAKLRDIGLDGGELRACLCLILAVPTDDACAGSGDELKRQTFHAVASLVWGLSQRAPVVLVIEDLHWIDEASREMLDLAMAEVRGRIMLVVTHRPDAVPAWRTTAALTQLRLRPLVDDDITRIVRAVADGELPAALEAAVRAKAEGNPFFAEEITRSLLEDGTVERTAGQLVLVRPLAEMRLPGTVEEVIAARVDRFGSDAKRVSQVAAVLGRQFRRTHLLHLLEGEAVDVVAGLEELARRGVVHRKTVLSDDEYRFGESLTQDVLYEALLHKERRHLHEQIATMLEAEAGAADTPALIAHHFARSDSPERAVQWLLRAAHRAEALPSYSSAMRLYRRAWELAERAVGGGATVPDALRRGAVTAAIGVARMTVIYSVADADSERVVRRAEEFATTLSDTESLAALETFRGLIVMTGARERFPEGLALVEAGFEQVARAGLTVAARNVSRGLAWGYLHDGQVDRSLTIFEAAVYEMQGTDDERHLSDLYLGSRYMRDSTRYHADDFAGAIAAAAETYEMASRVDNRTVLGGSASTLALAHLARGEFADAKRWAERSLEVAEAIGNIGSLRTAAIVLIEARTALGETFHAGRYAESIEQEHAAPGDMAMKSLLAVEALLRVGETQRARLFVETAERHAGGRLRELLCAVASAEVRRHSGSDGGAALAQSYEHAIVVATRLGARSVLTAALLGAAQLAATLGDDARAAAYAGLAAETAAAIGLRRYDGALAHVRPVASAPLAAAGMAAS